MVQVCPATTHATLSTESTQEAWDITWFGCFGGLNTRLLADRRRYQGNAGCATKGDTKNETSVSVPSLLAAPASARPTEQGAAIGAGAMPARPRD
jgi:hypothetical protein